MQRLIAPMFESDNVRHILQISFRYQASGKVVCLAPLHTVLVAGIVKDSFFLRGRNMVGVDLRRRIHIFSKILEQSDRLRGGGIVFQCHNAAYVPPQMKWSVLNLISRGAMRSRKSLGWYSFGWGQPGRRRQPWLWFMPI